MTERQPGLIGRKFVKEHTPSCVEIQETWNPAVNGCPILVINLASGLVDKGVVTVTRNILIGKDEWVRLGDGEQPPANKLTSEG